MLFESFLHYDFVRADGWGLKGKKACEGEYGEEGFHSRELLLRRGGWRRFP